jgi:hypothetical protein
MFKFQSAFGVDALLASARVRFLFAPMPGVFAIDTSEYRLPVDLARL